MKLSPRSEVAEIEAGKAEVSRCFSERSITISRALAAEPACLSSTLADNQLAGLIFCYMHFHFDW